MTGRTHAAPHDDTLEPVSLPVTRTWAFGTALVACLLVGLAVVAAALAAPPRRCAQLHGRNLASRGVVRVVRLKLPTIAPRGHDSGIEQRSGLFGCRLPNGPVHRLATAGRSYFNGQRNAPVESATATIGASTGQFATVIEATNTLIGEAFLMDRVVNAATGGRLYIYLNTSSSPGTTSLASPLRTLLSPSGVLVGLFPLLGADGSQVSERLIAFASSRGQALDTAANDRISAASIALAGAAVTWTDAGLAKSAPLPAP
jgi:hypothetical protein